MKKLMLTVLALLLLGVVNVYGQMKVGYMNPQIVLDQLPEKEAIERQLNVWLDQKEAEFEALAIEFQNKMTTFQREAPDLTESQTRERQAELQQLNANLEEYQFQVEFELEQRQVQLLQPILTEMNVIIEELAKSLNLDYVLNEATAQGELLLIHISADGKSKYNLTDAVLKRMLN